MAEKVEPNVSSAHGHLIVNRYVNEAIKIEARIGDDIVIEVIDIEVDSVGENGERLSPFVKLRISAPKNTPVHRSTRTISHSTYEYTPRKSGENGKN